jgi:hypothetical protein
MSPTETSAQGVANPEAAAGAQAAQLGYSGVWLSRYEFYSSSREETFTGAHHILLLQTEDRITGRSISPNSLDPGSSMSLDLTVDRNIITGTWRERTGEEGFYRGASYYGALQMLAEPTGRRIVGKWVGYGKDFDVNTGPWELVFLDANTAPATIERYSSAPEA